MTDRDAKARLLLQLAHEREDDPGAYESEGAWAYAVIDELDRMSQKKNGSKA